MSFSAALTVLTDSLIALTLIYCIVLERRIRAFRKQEQFFRTLMSDVSESTRVAQGTVSSLRQLLTEFSNLNAAAPKGAQTEKFKSDSRIEGEIAARRFGDTENSIATLAARIAALRNQ